MNVFDRLSHAWNAFQNKDPTPRSINVIENGYFTRPDRHKLSIGADQTIISSIYNRIAIDVSAIDIEHIRVDENENFVEKIQDSSLNYIFSTEANIDQTSREFIRDIVISMFDEGCVALVPTDTNTVPKISGAFEIDSIRTGKITQWYPSSVEVEVYNEKTGEKERLKMPKRTIGIIENPLYSVMNEPNSTLRRLIRKLALLDQVDEQSSSGKLDLIIQLPYIIKSEARRKQAQERRKEIEDQLTNSKYGIAYTDGTEKVVQLGHPIENNLLTQIEYLTKTLYSQLGLTEAVFNGTASEEEMKNYYRRTVEPVISAITEECQRKFLTKTARKQRQRITFFIDPFKLVPMKDLADLANSLSRNEIVSANEIRAVIGFKPSTDPRADQLINSNVNPNGGEAGYEQYPMDYEQFADNQYSQMENIDSQLDDMRNMYHDGLYHTGANEPPGGYASKYYDPDKAHEYYEKTKKLKGRRSNSGLNEAGIEAAEYMRKQVDEEHARELGMHRDEAERKVTQLDTDLESTVKSISSNLDMALEAARNATASNIETAKAKLQTVIANSSERLQNQVNQLREKMATSPNEAARRGFENQIEQLAEANAKNRDALSEQFADEYANAQSNYKTTAKDLHTKAKEDVASAKENTSKAKTSVAENYQKVAQELEEKYGQIMVDEMDKIRANPAYQEQKKSSSGKSSSSTSSKSMGAAYYNAISDYMRRNRRRR
jgi:hypothetical protein